MKPTPIRPHKPQDSGRGYHKCGLCGGFKSNVDENYCEACIPNFNKAMEDMECWQVDEHLKKCKDHEDTIQILRHRLPRN